MGTAEAFLSTKNRTATLSFTFASPVVCRNAIWKVMVCDGDLYTTVVQRALSPRLAYDITPRNEFSPCQRDEGGILLFRSG